MSRKTREQARTEAERLGELLQGRPVLVTGGGGFLGGEITTQLRSAGIPVRSLARGHYTQLAGMGVEQYSGDISDSEVVVRAADGCGLVIHGAAKVGAAGSREEFHRINVLGTQSVISACRRSGVSALVHTSTPSVVFGGGDICGGNESLPLSTHHHSAYTATKAEAETLALSANESGRLAVCAIRPHLVWGPGDRHILPRLVARRKSGRLRRVGPGDNVVDVTYVGDGARAHILAGISLLSPSQSAAAGNPYFISQGQPVRLWWMIDEMLKAAGQPPVNRRISVRGAYAVGAFLEMAHRILRLSSEPIMTRWVALELATHHWFDISAARRDLNYSPTVTVEEGLEALTQWCSEVAQDGTARTAGSSVR